MAPCETYRNDVVVIDRAAGFVKALGPLRSAVLGLRQSLWTTTTAAFYSRRATCARTPTPCGGLVRVGPAGFLLNETRATVRG